MTKEERINKFKEAFSKIFTEEEIDNFKYELDDLNFFTAPASTKFHGNYEGGLFDHSFAVMTHLVELTEKLNLHWLRPCSPYIVGLLHDLCKCDSYVYDEDKNAYVWANPLLTGHGDKSAILAEKVLAFIGNRSPLTEEETLCIRWHMGAFDDKENWNNYGNAIEKYPNVLYTHTADMIAARVDLI